MGEYVIAGVLSLTALWLLFMVFGIARKEEIARHAVKNTQAELAELEERRIALEANMAELSTARGQEATVRQAYGVAKPGEEVIIVVPAEEEEAPPKIPWFKRLMGWFGWW